MSEFISKKIIDAATGAVTSSGFISRATSHQWGYKTTGSTTSVSIKIQGSHDGLIWADIGSALTDNTGASANFTGLYLWLRIVLTTLSGGTSPTLTACYNGVN